MNATTKTRVLNFWSWFSSVRPKLELALQNGENFAASTLCSAKLKSLSLPFLCETDYQDGVFSLSLCPFGNKTEQFVCRYLCQLAPETAHWNFFAFHGPHSAQWEPILPIPQDRLDLSSLSFFYTENEEHQKYDITVVAKSFAAHSQSENRAQMMLLLYLFLGEAMTEIYIGELLCSPVAPPSQNPPLSFSEFLSMVQSTPATHAWPWVNDPTALCFGYHPSGEHVEGLRGDILGGLSRHVPLLHAPFDEADLLRSMGGCFCYFYYPTTPEHPDEIPKRADLATRMEQLLEHYGIGYSLGHALGAQYCYLDLMIFDEPVFRAVFQDTEALLGVPLFFEYFGRPGVQ